MSSGSKRTRFQTGSTNDSFSTPGRRGSSTEANNSNSQDKEFASILSPSKYRRDSLSSSPSTEPRTEFFLDSSIDQSNDEDSVKLLKQQLAHVQQIKFDNQRKQQMITDLHQQLDELLKFKDEAFHYKNEVEILRERLKLKEEELRRINEETAESVREYQRIEKDLRSEMAKVSRQSLEDSETKDAKIKELKAKLSAATANAEAAEKERAEIERQLTSLTSSLKEQQGLLDHKASQQKELTRKLQEQIVLLTDSRNESNAKIVQLETSLRNSQLECSHKDVELERIKRDNEKLEEAKKFHLSTIDSLEMNLNSLKEKVMELNIENNIVEDLRRELSIIPELKDELTRVVNVLSLTQDALDKERMSLKMVTDERDRLLDLNSHLEAHNDNLRSENAGMREELDSLQTVRQEVLFVSKELEHAKQLNADLEQQLSKLQKQREDKTERVKTSTRTIAQELTRFQQLIESVLSGDTYSLDTSEVDSHLENVIEQELREMDGMRSVLMGTRSRVMDALYEISDLREKSKGLQIDLDNKNSQLATLDVDKSELHRDLLNLRKLTSDQEKTIRTLEEQRANMERNIMELEDLIEEQQDEERNRTRFVNQLFRQLKGNVTDRNFDGSPVKGAKSVSIHSEVDSITWESLQAQFAEQISKHIVERDALKKDRMMLETKVAELDDSYHRQLITNKEAQQRFEEDRRDIEKAKQRELDDLRRKYEEELDSVLSEYKEKIRGYEDKDSSQLTELNDLNIKHKKASVTIDMLKNDIETLQIEREKLQNCLKLMARGIRPMRSKIADLKDHKKILTLQMRYLERLHRNMYESVKHLSGDFQLEMELGFSPKILGNPKPSLRAAAIAVIAFNRFNKIRNKPKKDEVYNVGSDKVHLLADSEVADIDPSKLPFGTEPSEKVGVQSFMQLCLYLDPHVDDERTTKDMRLIMSLQDGLDKIVNQQKTVTSADLNSSLLQTPSKRKAFDTSLLGHKSPAKTAIEAVQKTTLGVTKILKDLTKERNTLQKEVVELNERIVRLQRGISESEENARKKQDLVHFMESRINELQNENMDLIQPEKYNLLQKEIEKLRENYANIQYEKEQFKQEFENQMNSLNNYRKDVQDLQDKLRERTARLETVQKELQTKKVETETLQNIINRHSEMLKELEHEKNKYESMVSDLRDKLYKRTADVISSRLSMDVGSSLASPAKPEVLSSTTGLSPSFSSLRKRVERDLNESQLVMKQLTESTAKTNREVHELDKELKHARKHLAELQQNLSNGSFAGSPTLRSTASPLSPPLSLSNSGGKRSAQRSSSAGRTALRSRNFALDDSTDLDVQEDLFSLARPPSRRSRRTSSTLEY